MSKVTDQSNSERLQEIERLKALREEQKRVAARIGNAYLIDVARREISDLSRRIRELESAP